MRKMTFKPPKPEAMPEMPPKMPMKPAMKPATGRKAQAGGRGGKNC